MEALFLLCIIELSQGRKDGSKYSDTILDYCILVSKLNPAFPPVLNVMANYILQQQKSYKAKLIDGNMLSTIQVYCDSQEDIAVDDIFEIGEVVASVVAITCSLSGDLLVADVTLSSVLLLTSENVTVKVTKASKVSQLAVGALNLSNNGSVRSESLYLLGKVRHLRGDLEVAFDFYRNALKEDPNMILAQFEAARILFSRKDFMSAFDLFSIILKKYPEDRDTQGFLMLISSILHREVYSVEKIKDQSKFQFVLDLWLIQAYNRHHDFNEYQAAIKCYHSAIETASSSGNQLPATSLVNLSVLYHAIGKLKLSLNYLQQAICIIRGDNAGFTAANNGISEATFNLVSEDFDGFLYTWQLFSIVPTSIELQGNTITLYFDSGEISQIISSNDILRINGIIVSVQSATSNYLRLHGPLVHLIKEQDSFSVERKLCYLKHFDEIPLLLFNYSRILEDCGKYVAALELYNYLISKNPGFLECIFHSNKS